MRLWKRVFLFRKFASLKASLYSKFVWMIENSASASTETSSIHRKYWYYIAVHVRWNAVLYTSDWRNLSATFPCSHLHKHNKLCVTSHNFRLLGMASAFCRHADKKTNLFHFRIYKVESILYLSISEPRFFFCIPKLYIFCVLHPSQNKCFGNLLLDVHTPCVNLNHPQHRESVALAQGTASVQFCMISDLSNKGTQILGKNIHCSSLQCWLDMQKNTRASAIHHRQCII
jgi:hypothetical protein